jgi:hypothetical protein
LKRSTSGRILALLALVGLVPVVATCSLIQDFDSMKNGQCASGKKACPFIRKCVPLDDPAMGCGDVSTCSRCPDRPNATATCEQRECAMQCQDGWADCDGLADNGCEIELAMTPESRCPADGGVDDDSGGTGGSGAGGSGAGPDSGAGGTRDGAVGDGPKVVSPCRVAVDFNNYTLANLGCGGYATGCKGQIHFMNTGTAVWYAPTMSFTVRSGVVCVKSHSLVKWTMTDNGATSHRCVFKGREPDVNGVSWPIGPGASFGFGFDSNQTESYGAADITISADSCSSADAGSTVLQYDAADIADADADPGDRAADSRAASDPDGG